MGAMAGAGLPSLGRVRLIDLVATDGLSSDKYKLAVNTLSQSLTRYYAAIIELPVGDDVMLRCAIDSGRMYFHQRPYQGTEMIHSGEAQDWNKTSGYFTDPQIWQETFDYRPGQTPIELSCGAELPPAGLPDLFSFLGKAARDILDAIGCSLELRSFCFTDLLDNMPLKNGEVSSSVLSVCCHGRPGFQSGHHATITMAAQEQTQIPIFGGHDPDVDKSFLTLVRSDKPGLQIRDIHSRWILVDGDLGPQDIIVYPGLALYQATAGYINPALHRTDIGSLQGSMYGRCSLSFKLMPRASGILHCTSMTSAGHGVGAPFQQPISVHDFMQRTHPMDQLMSRQGFMNFSYPVTSDVSVKAVFKRRKQTSRSKPLAPSKRLRLEAQRVLKERVQEIADRKGIKLRFCGLRECEEQHIPSLDSPCGVVRTEIGWPHGVPFVHPHDLPNKAKLAFLEAYEPGWTASQDMEVGYN
ncbi:uncharacterized protein LOC131070569 [Cryptomeria japonica]|uniref:uncharacterized protein LOC131070569 n=1 Tax=Cryptomeria japonica TaxID=3369 RepID=UPI0025ACE0D7|nr:uncharacterized protein LOC131070569 [Cryptomeria japonica]XP_057862128.1 uncharacterized protein LOC131070569 [Cryptomeria japonica]XP_057862129.1 uncharacterized protein LOC131070569 [Cryptomeria japonica]XP_057862130.1 uncharacterized protein LOC131070569 [Cryptomeria japonica]XP_057862131.1 uncharacterized protein LOC131070569 [Cryptomeria japonica]